jgi:hypothetical protein
VATLAATAAVGLCGVTGASAAAWRLEAVVKAREAPISVSCAASRSCTAVGYEAKGPAFVARERGNRWQPRAYYYAGDSVSCRRTWCVAVGNDMILGPYAERSHGAGWTGEQIPGGGYVRGVSCVSFTDCVAVGTATTSTTGFDCTTPACTVDHPAIERLQGQHWSVQSAPDPAILKGRRPCSESRCQVYLEAVSCSAAWACMAVGDWTARGLGAGSFAERWDGRRWTVARIPRPADSFLDSVSCSAADACTAVGNSGVKGNRVLVERWNGRRWRAQPAVSPGSASDALFESVSCAGRRACVAVGYVKRGHVGGARVITPAGSIPAGVLQPLVERWNGTGWTVQRPASPPHSASRGGSLLSSVSCPSLGTCTAVGSDAQGWFAERDS